MVKLISLLVALAWATTDSTVTRVCEWASTVPLVFYFIAAAVCVFSWLVVGQRSSR